MTYSEMVHDVVQRFGGTQNQDELFRVGCVGLVKALDNYSVTCGVDLSTYAAPMIIGEIRRYLRAEKTQLGKGSVDEMTCKDCKHFIGGGDRGLCCDLKYNLCYETTPACGEYEPKEKALTEAETSSVSAQLKDQVQDTASAEDCQGPLTGDLNKLIQLRRDYMWMCDKTGLISPEGSNGIHLKEDYFLALFAEYEVSLRGRSEYPFCLTAAYGGVDFFCITAKLPEGE